MNILFLDAYHEPEIIAYTHLEKDLIEGLISDGHKIHIICPVPTRGITERIKTQYKNKKYEIKYNGRVTIERFWSPQEGKNPLMRALRYFWCNIRTYQKASKKKNYDVIYSNSTPPTQGALCVLVAKKMSKKSGKKIPFIYNLQDIFPDSLVNTSLTSEGSFIWKAGRILENFTYKHADKIILISQGFKRNVLKKGVPEEKIEIISNWIDLDFVYPIERKDNKLINEFGLDPNKFIVVYAGNFGASQGADTVLKAAKNLEEYDDILFVIFGGGPYFKNAQKEAQSLSNVFIHGLMPQERISEVYSLGNVALITCKAGTGKSGMPSKVWSIMACNTPIIAAFDMDSDLAETIRDSGAGECVEPENSNGLSKIILTYYVNKRSYNCINSREYVRINASKERCVPKYKEQFAKI